MPEPRILSIVLAGGEGKRLAPLTADRAKPAVPFGGHYRIVDFCLSNLANAGYLKIVVLTQYKSHSLDLHITRTWRLSTLLGSYVTPVPAQMRRGTRWFAGSADALYQNLNLVNDEDPEYVIVFGSDHIYRMDPRQMVEQHIATGAGVTVAGIRTPRSQSDQFGVINMGEATKIASFQEKPTEVQGLADSPDEIFASMGNYVFTRSAMVEAVSMDAEDQSSRHDIGGNLIPAMVDAGEAHVYDFSSNHVPGSTERDHAYWRDVGTLDSYYDAHMDLVSVHPVFNLYNRQWPIFTSLPTLPPAKFVLQGSAGNGAAYDSMVCAGSIISGGTVRSSVISPGVLVNAHASVDASVLMHDVVIGAGAIVRHAIIDKNVKVPPGAQIGIDRDEDEARFTVSEGGIVVIGKGEKIPETLMRVALFAREYPPEIYGGAGVAVEYLARELDRLDDVEVDVHCFGAPRSSPLVKGAYQPWADLPSSEPHDAALRTVSVDLQMAARSHGADLAHSHTWYANLAGHLAKMVHGIPHVMTTHSLEPLRPWKAEQLGGGYALSCWCEKTGIDGADAVIAVSGAMRQDVLSCYPEADPDKVVVIHNGVDTDEFHPVKTVDALVAHGIDPDRPSIVFVGRITRQKGIDHLLAAAPHIDPEAQLVLLPSAPDTPQVGEEMRALAAEIAARRGNLLWIEEVLPRPQLIQVLSQATAFVCPSVYEPFGLVNVEAMACGAAVVASAVGGIPEVVADGETGYLVPFEPGSNGGPADPKAFALALAEGVNRVLADPTRAQAMGQAGRRRAVELFSWAAIARQTADLYASLLP